MGVRRGYKSSQTPNESIDKINRTNPATRSTKRDDFPFTSSFMYKRMACHICTVCFYFIGDRIDSHNKAVFQNKSNDEYYG